MIQDADILTEHDAPARLDAAAQTFAMVKKRLGQVNQLSAEVP